MRKQVLLVCNDDGTLCHRESSCSNRHRAAFYPIISKCLENVNAGKVQRVVCLGKTKVYWNELQSSGLQTAVGLMIV